jgi:hypothetical protein
MSKIAISGASTGTATFTLESPATSTNRTLTLPDNTGTILTNATAGTVLQAVFASTLTQVEGSFSTATSLGLAASITPTSASNKILVLVSANGLGVRGSGLTYWDGYLSRGGTNLGAFGNYIGANLTSGGFWGASLCFLDSPNTTSSITYALTGIRTTGSDNCIFNISTGIAGTGTRSTMTLLEIVA